MGKKSNSMRLEVEKLSGWPYQIKPESPRRLRSLDEADDSTDLIEGSSIWHVDVATNLEMMESIADQWRDLERKSPNSATSFQSYNWCRAHLASSQERFAIINVFQNDQLVLVFPLSIHNRFGLSVATWLGDPFTQYGDVLIDKDAPYAEAVKLAWQAMLEIPGLDVLTLRKVRSDAAISTATELKENKTDSHDLSAILELGEFKSIECYLNSLKSKYRRNRKRIRRNLEKAGEVRFEIVEDETRRFQLIEKAIELKTSWLVQRGLMSRAAFSHSPFGILPALRSAEGDSFQTIVSHLELDGQTAALEVGFLWNNRYFAYLGCFEPDFASMSPGTIQMEDTISWLISNGVETYDLFAPLDPYKSQWSNSTVSVGDYQIGMTWAGQCYVNQFEGQIIPALRHIYNGMPDALRHWAAKLILQ